MTNLKFLQKFFFFLLIGFSLCIMHACEPDPDPDPDPDEKLNELVGTWKYYFSSGYEVKCFNSDGTGYKQEYDEADGGWHSKDEFNYTYYKESGKLIMTDKEENKTYIYKVISLTSEILELEDPDGNLDTYYRVEGEIENPDTKNELVGTWKDYFSSGYVVKCFNSDGTGYEQEYDEADGGWYSKDEFNYTYYKESGKLIITDKEENKTYIYKVISLTSEILELEDPDGDLDTYYRVEGEIENPDIKNELVGTWKDSWGDGPRGYTAYSFFDDGTGLYFDKGNGARRFTYTYDKQAKIVNIEYSEYQNEQLEISKLTANTLVMNDEEYKKSELTYDMLILGEWYLHVDAYNSLGKSTRVLFSADYEVEGIGTYEAKDYYNGDGSGEEFHYSFYGLSNKVNGTWSISNNKLSIKGKSQIAGDYIIEGLVVNGCRLIRESNPNEQPYLFGGWHDR